ncbi:MAG: hypothetical protein RJB66_364 [Pseudomonadota bacterium]|jgi:PAS domain-containing protein
MNEIILIGWNEKPWSFEATLFNNVEAFLGHNKNDDSRCIFIVKCPSEIDQLKSVLVTLSSKHEPILLIGIEHYATLDLVKISSQYPVVAMLNSSDWERTEDLLNALLLTRRLEEQELAHQKLLREEEFRQEKQYEQLLLNLREQQSLITEIQNRLLNGLQQEKLLHDTLLIIMTSQGIGEIELRLEETLAPLLGPLHLRLILHDGSSHPQSWANPSIAFELHEQEQSLGRMIVTPTGGQNFERKELLILENISEAIALHIPRFLAFEANALLETEWRATFDAILDPVLLVNGSYMVVEANKSARDRAEKNKTSTSKPCYEVMFGRSHPCIFCRFGTKSNLEPKSSAPAEQWEMSSHELRIKKSAEKIYVHLYRNKFSQIELETRISDFAKNAEVGIFKSSLAHELNNPIGGLLTLAQLQKMDLIAGHPLLPLVEEIEKQALLCRDLILDLLQRARNAPTPTKGS